MDVLNNSAIKTREINLQSIIIYIFMPFMHNYSVIQCPTLRHMVVETKVSQYLQIGH